MFIKVPPRPSHPCRCIYGYHRRDAAMQLMMLVSGHMPRGPNVVISLCIVSNVQQDPSYICMWACCPFLKRLDRLSGQLANACMEHQSIDLHCSSTKLGFEVPCLSLITTFLTNADLCTELWMHASYARILVCSFASSSKRP